MSRLASAAISAFAFANFYLLFLTGPLISPQHDLTFHLPGSATTLFLAVLVDLFALWLLLTGLLWISSHRPWLDRLTWAALLLLLPATLVQTVAVFLGVPVPSWLSTALHVAVCIGLLFVILRPGTAAAIFSRVRPLLTTVLGFLAVAGVLLLVQLLWFGWEARDLNPAFHSGAPKSASTQAGSPHVVWIILDELAFDQLYGERPAGLNLPSFDRLSRTATVLTHALPTAEYTRVAVPSLLTGLAVKSASPSADGRRLTLRVHNDAQAQPFEPRDTVFSDATRRGLSTGVAGWYEPYCRLLPAVLDRCFWTYSDEISGGMQTDWSPLRNAAEPPRRLAASLLHRIGAGAGVSTSDSLDVERHRADYRALLAAGDALFTQDQPNLVLLHMPIPHPWGFYDRHSGTFPDHRTSYIDNLVLADRYVGHVRALLEAQGAWDNTDLVIMGDHSWRTSFVWKRSGYWTAEDEQASHGGVFDDRPAMIVKLHHQATPARIDAPYAAVRTRALLDALLERKMGSPSDLQQWIEGAHQGEALSQQR